MQRLSGIRRSEIHRTMGATGTTSRLALDDPILVLASRTAGTPGFTGCTFALDARRRTTSRPRGRRTGCGPASAQVRDAIRLALEGIPWLVHHQLGLDPWRSPQAVKEPRQARRRSPASRCWTGGTRLSGGRGVTRRRTGGCGIRRHAINRFPSIPRDVRPRVHTATGEAPEAAVARASDTRPRVPPHSARVRRDARRAGPRARR